MSSNFSYSKNNHDGRITLELSGQIDEDAELSGIDLSGASEIEFNLKGVSLINSCGIRDWVEFQKGIPESVNLIYSFCPQVIVEQVNMIKGFIREGATVKSFYAPYYDEKNDKEVKVLLSPVEIVNLKAPEKKNEEGESLEFDEIELQYFNFLKNN